ncbi:DNA-(apurinic or apyrimidinic site) endonuclease-like [Medicago truncatula]|uniref:DNA-(apurinic or apyrimidinic site) endonuclease-like n=1 Tax=Medicago truncatula TaxID=3880 RepID=UPI000D2F3007|nr:DNA-(apurinic or apyrimidinic site) endonuclease-like [Medicago truncatula]
MRVVSWNVRGLGGLEKRKEVKELVKEKAPFVLCIQETKLQLIDDFVCTSIWGPMCHDYSFSPSVGASGGLVTIWDTAEVEVWTSCRGDNFLLIHGRFIKSNEEFYLFNVYAPCDRFAKQALWTSLSSRLLSLGSLNVCLCGDFNSVRSADERRSVRGTQTLDDFSHFNEFIDECVLIDLPLCGRKFTWFKGDGRSMSRLDRFLLSEAWCLLWPNCIQVGHLRGLSDHCPIVLSVDEENWGPRRCDY